MDPGDNIFDEIEDFLNSPLTTPDEPPSATVVKPSTPGQTSNVNQYSSGGQGLGGGVIKGGGPSSMINNGYTSNGCSLQTKAVLGGHLMERLGGRGDHPPSGELKRKLEEGSLINDPIFNKTPKILKLLEKLSFIGKIVIKPPQFINWTQQNCW